MAKRSKIEAEKTRESLLDAAEKVFLAKGIGAASLEEIAKVAGVTRGALYWHFEDKYALAKAMHERVKLPMDAMFEEATQEADALGALRKLCIHMLRELATNGRMQRVMTIILFRCEQADTQACMNNQIKKRTEAVQRFEKIFRQAARQKRLAPGVTPPRAAAALYAYMSGFFSDYLRHDKPFDIARAAPELVEIFFRGISHLTPSSAPRRKN